MKLQESLSAYRDYKFFSLLEAKEKEKKNNFFQKKDEKKEKGVKKDAKSKDPEKALQEKEAAQAAKDAMDIVKKVRDNFARFKSFAGTQVGEYKNFWDMQKKATQAVCAKDPACKLCYALFADGTSDKYNPSYLICLRNVEGNLSLSVYKTHLEEGEENPTFSVSNDQAENEFKSFFSELKKELADVKNNYIKNVETKKKEEEHQKKREKLDKFLKA